MMEVPYLHHLYKKGVLMSTNVKTSEVMVLSALVHSALALFLVALMIVACGQPSAPQQDASNAVEPVVVARINAENTPIALAPDMANIAFDRYKVTVRRNGVVVKTYGDLQPLPSAAGSNPFEATFRLVLHSGVFAITVEAYENNAIVATATTTLTALVTGPKLCAVTLHPISDKGTGTLAWNLKLPSDVTGALTLTNTQGATVESLQVSPPNNNSSKAINAGTYNLRLTLANSTGSLQVVPLDKTCFIYAGLSTSVTDDYTAYTFADKITVSGNVIVTNPSLTPTSAIVVTAYTDEGKPFDPPVTRAYPVGEYTTTTYNQPYALALPQSALKTKPIIRASFSKPSNEYHFTATDASPTRELTTEGATKVNPELTLTTTTPPTPTTPIMVSGTIIVDNPAGIDLGDITVTDTVTLTQAKATSVKSDGEHCAYTYSYSLTLPSSAIDTTTTIALTFGVYTPAAPDCVFTLAPKAMKLTSANTADFRVCLYGLTAGTIQNHDKLVAFVRNRAREAGTNTIYLWGDNITNTDLTDLGKAIGNAEVGVNMLHCAVSDAVLPAGAFANCKGLTSIAIGGGIKTVSKAAFANCKKLKAVNIGRGVETVSDGAFSTCPNLETISVDKRNSRLASFDNTLYTIDQTTLVAYAPGNKARSFIVPRSVTAIGAQAFSSNVALESVSIPGTVRTIGEDAFAACTALSNVALEEGVKEIDAGAFRDCVALPIIGLPESLRSIGNEAFINCASIDGVTIPRLAAIQGARTFANCGKMTCIGMQCSVICDEMFLNCSALTRFDIPNTVVSVGERAFEGCAGLKEIVVGRSVRTIGDYAFFNCGKIKSVAFSGTDNTLESIGNYAFAKNIFDKIAIPDSVETIGEYAFQECANLEQVTIGKSVERIYKGAFSGCVCVKEIVIPGSVKTVGEDAFSGCDNLEDAVVEEGVEVIGARAFMGCKELTAIILPKTVTRVDDDAFNGCKEIKEVGLCEGLQTIGARAFKDCFSDAKQKAFWDLHFSVDWDDLVIPNSVKTIGEEAFCNCFTLKHITIGCGISEIAAGTFQDCDGLETIVIPGNVQSIGDHAFMGCQELRCIEIEYGVKTIERLAFQSCYSSQYNEDIKADWFNDRSDHPLMPISLPSTLETIGNGAFSYCKYLKKISVGKNTALEDLVFEYSDDIESITLGAGITARTGLAHDFDAYYANCDRAAGTYTLQGGHWRQ
jgi:hypothetical protein